MKATNAVWGSSITLAFETAWSGGSGVAVVIEKAVVARPLAPYARSALKRPCGISIGAEPEVLKAKLNELRSVINEVDALV